MDPNISNQPIRNEIPATQPNLQQPISQSSFANSRWKPITYIIGVILSMNISFLIYAWTNGFIVTSIAAIGDSPLTYFIYLIVTPLISIFTFGTVLYFFVAIVKHEMNSNQRPQLARGVPIAQSDLQQSTYQIPQIGKWRLKKRYLYSLLYGIPGFFVSIPLFFISSISLLFICSPMDPHNICSEHPFSFYIFIPLFFLPWWIIFIRMGFVAGKKLEAEQVLNKKHILASVVITLVFILIFVIFVLIPIGGIGQIKNFSKLL